MNTQNGMELEPMDISFQSRAQLDALQLPQEEDPYPLYQAAEVREYARRRRDSLLAQTALDGKTILSEIAADFVQSAIVSTEDQVYSVFNMGDREDLKRRLLARAAGFESAGREQTGLEPPATYRRIGAVAAGFAANLDKQAVHM
jgi:hypothetical protein